MAADHRPLFMTEGAGSAPTTWLLIGAFSYLTAGLAGRQRLAQSLMAEWVKVGNG